MSQFFQGVVAGSLPPSVPTSFLLDDTGVAVPLSNQIIVHGATGVDTSLGASNEIVINVVSDGFAWSEQNGDFSATAQNGYFCNSALTVTLPATAGLSIGNTIIIYVDTSSPVIVQANTGQMIQVGSTISISGGTSTSNTRGAILELIFKPSDLTWHTQSSLGVWNTV